jgi:hypothetical protein
LILKDRRSSSNPYVFYSLFTGIEEVIARGSPMACPTASLALKRSLSAVPWLIHGLTGVEETVLDQYGFFYSLTH